MARIHSIIFRRTNFSHAGAGLTKNAQSTRQQSSAECIHPPCVKCVLCSNDVYVPRLCLYLQQFPRRLSSRLSHGCRSRFAGKALHAWLLSRDSRGRHGYYGRCRTPKGLEVLERRGRERHGAVGAPVVNGKRLGQRATKHAAHWNAYELRSGVVLPEEVHFSMGD